MAEQAERAFAQAFLNTLAAQPVSYADDYQQPPEHSLKRVPVLPIPVPPPPARKPRLEPAASTSGLSLLSPIRNLVSEPPDAASLSLTFKSIKPAFSAPLSAHPTDTISSIKALLSSSSPSAPPADAIRLLLKGKALADSKLLKEYSVKEGDTINIVVKPGVNWDPSKPNTTPAKPTNTEKMDTSSSSSSSTPANPFKFGSGSLSPNPNAPATPPKQSGGHRRIPSVVLSPSPSESNSPGGEVQEKDIMLTLDPVTDLTAKSSVETTYHETVADPMFWSRLHTFLENEFKTAADVHTAFEDFLCATKGSLTPSEIAKIRDTVGVVGMAGT